MTLWEFAQALWVNLDLNLILSPIVSILLLDKLERKWHNRNRVVYRAWRDNRENMSRMPSPKITSQTSQQH